ncbi:MAG: HAMP domain-containing sensor histidine kinase [Planctomycetota bacterium]
MAVWVLPTIAGSVAIGLWLGWLTAGRLASRQQSRAQAAERRARAAERLAELGSMTAGLAHEIKNPLSTIGLNTQLLVEAIGELDQQDERVGRLARRVGVLGRETERLAGILGDFLEYAGDKRLSPAPADIGELASELVDFIHAQAERSGVRVRLQREGGALTATVDAGLIKQALLNLMLNALQAMGAGGDAEAGDRPSELLIRVESWADSVRVRVADTGPGMDDETRSSVFTPYFTTKPGGTGLGLPTTRRIIEQHHGTVELFSKPGQGTEFVIELPVAWAGEEPLST